MTCKFLQLTIKKIIQPTKNRSVNQAIPRNHSYKSAISKAQKSDADMPFFGHQFNFAYKNKSGFSTPFLWLSKRF